MKRTLDVPLPAAVACAVVAVPAATGGGYAPSWWGWLSFLPLVVAAFGLAVRPVALSRGDVQLVGGLALFVAWTGVSAVWSQSVPRTVAEVERDAIVVTAGLALLVVRRTPFSFVVGLLAATGGVAVEALGSRFLNGGAGRLDGPLIYWNALGVLCAVGVVLALGIASGTHGAGTRAAAAALTVVFASTLYLTYSRGAVAALAAGLVLLFALDARRVRPAVVTATVAPPAFAAALLAAHAPRVVAALAVLLLAAAAGAGALASDRLAARFERRTVRRRAAVGAVSLISALALAGVLHAGGVSALSARAASSLQDRRSAAAAPSDKRFLTFSDQGRRAYWRVAWQEYTAKPLGGTGAGTFELSWERHRKTFYGVRDAHNLYLETLAETGPFGLVLLLVALSAPFLRTRVTRRRPLGPALLAAYGVILVHAAIDWDWELPVVVCTGIACGVAAISVRAEPRRELDRAARRLGVVALAVLAVVALGVQYANSAEAHASAALVRAEPDQAARDARRARMVEPWASEPLRILGEAALADHENALARRRFRAAIGKDPEDWRLWYDLATASTGRDQAAALSRAFRLNPLEPTLLDFAGSLRIAAPRRTIGQ